MGLIACSGVFLFEPIRTQTELLISKKSFFVYLLITIEKDQYLNAIFRFYLFSILKFLPNPYVLFYIFVHELTFFHTFILAIQYIY